MARSWIRFFTITMTVTVTVLALGIVWSRKKAAQTTSTGGTQPRPSPPHIIMIMVDDLGWNGFSLHGHNDEVKNPTMEELAQDGILLENYYVYQYCAPSRAAFLTGRVPGHGIWEHNPSDTARVGVNLQATMIPALLKHHKNYTTHQIGKWHQGFYAPAYTPLGRGFDTSFGFYMGGEDHFTSCQGCPNGIPPPDYSDHPRTCPAKSHGKCNVTCPQEGGIDLARNGQPAYGENGTAYTAYLWSREAVRVIETSSSAAAQNQQPMFLYLALHNVHQPVEAPPEFLDPIYPIDDYNATSMPRRYYNGMVFSVDQVIANVTAALKRTGMYDNSVIVISTDNGGTYEHKGAVEGSSNYPLRGYKYSYFEGGIRGFAMVVSPLLPSYKRGTKSQTLLTIYDWYTTFCSLAGIEDCTTKNDQLATVAPLDGVDAWKLLVEGKKGNNKQKRPASGWVNRGGPREEEALLGVGHGQVGALRHGDYKIIVGDPGRDGWSAQYPGSTHKKAVPMPGSKASCTNQHPCLFNITNDPTEEQNLAHDMPALTEKLVRRYKELSAAMNVPNGYEDQLSKLIWDGSYHVPKQEDEEACELMRRTGFWMPWRKEPQPQSSTRSEELRSDGLPSWYTEEVVLI